MLETENPTLPFGDIEKYRDWTIKKTGDGIICLDPKGNHCLPGNAFHTTVKAARKSVDYWILAQGDSFTWQLLQGHQGTETRGVNSSTDNSSRGEYTLLVGERDNDEYKASYEYVHNLRVTGKIGDDATVTITSMDHTGPMTPDAALSLANALRMAAIKALSLRRGDSYCGTY